METIPSLVTIDIGNSRIKLGQFDQSSFSRAGLPEPTETLALAPSGAEFDFAPLGEWLDAHAPPGAPLVVGSVSRPGAKQLRQFFDQPTKGRARDLRELMPGDMPITNLTSAPERVGVDRLAAAVAANVVRREKTPAIVIDFGTAITVDLVNVDGEFEGGAILPGTAMVASALHQGTDALPSVTPSLDGKSPESVGKSTEAAIEAGIYWGAVGSARELIARHADRLSAAPQVLVTGSTSPEVARLLGSPDYSVKYLPHLVLAGLAIAAVTP